MAGTEDDDAPEADESAVPSAAAVESPTADEVEGETLPLLELLERGVIEPPEAPYSWTNWVRWRAAAGARPEGTPAFSQRESRLWRTTMQALFGVEWRQAIPPIPAAEAAALTERANARPAAQAAASAAPLPPSRRNVPAQQGGRPPATAAEHRDLLALADVASNSAESEGSWRDLSIEELEGILCSPFKPGLESLSEFERRMARARAVLALRGVASDAPENPASHRGGSASRRLPS
jgi:hypothetical protein